MVFISCSLLEKTSLPVNVFVRSRTESKQTKEGQAVKAVSGKKMNSSSQRNIHLHQTRLNNGKDAVRGNIQTRKEMSNLQCTWYSELSSSWSIHSSEIAPATRVHNSMGKASSSRALCNLLSLLLPRKIKILASPFPFFGFVVQDKLVLKDF